MVSSFLHTAAKFCTKHGPEIAVAATGFFIGLAVASAIKEGEDIKESILEFHEDKDREPLQKRAIRILKAGKRTIVFTILAIASNVMGWWIAKKQITTLAALLATSQALNESAFSKLEELVPDEKERDLLINDIYDDAMDNVHHEAPVGEDASKILTIQETGTGPIIWEDPWTNNYIRASEAAIDAAILAVHKKAIRETTADWSYFYEQLNIKAPDSARFRIWSSDRLLSADLERVTRPSEVCGDEYVEGQLPIKIIVRPECDIFK